VPTFALFPPFDSICILTILVGIGLAVASRGLSRAPAVPALRRIPWGWLALYFVALAVLFVGLLILGHQVDPSHPDPRYK
jgi:hypothetical protein